jgi:hypothetical protein
MKKIGTLGKSFFLIAPFSKFTNLRFDRRAVAVKSNFLRFLQRANSLGNNQGRSGFQFLPIFPGIEEKF